MGHAHAPLWGRWMESHAGTVSAGAWRAAGAVGCGRSHGQARSSACQGCRVAAAAEVVGVALLGLPLQPQAWDTVATKSRTRLHEYAQAAQSARLCLEWDAVAAAAAPLWGILLESRAAMVPLDAAHPARVLGGCNEHVRARSSTRRASGSAFGATQHDFGRGLRQICSCGAAPHAAAAGR